MQNNKKISARVIVLLLVLWGVWSLRLNANFYGEQDAFRTWVPSAVRNYDIYEYDEIGLMVVRNGYVDEVENLYIYSHHPPLLTWLPALFVMVAGETETSIRFVFLVATMLASTAFYAMVKHLYDENVAFWSLLFFGITPMIAYFQPSYGHDPLGFMAFMLFGLLMVIWLEQPTLLRYVTLMSLAVMAVLSAWPAVIFIGMIGLFGMVYGTWLHRLGILILGFVSALGIVVFQLLYFSWWSGALESILDAFLWRTSNASFRRGSESFTALDWVSFNTLHLIYFGTFSLLVLGAIGLVAIWRTQKNKQFSNYFILTFLSAALIYMLVFRNATYIHTYYKAFLMPAFALGGAIVVVHLRDRHRLGKPVIDALVILLLLQSGFVLNQLISTTHEPNLTELIEYVDALPAEDEQIHITYVGISSGSENATEYYTMRNVFWNTLLPELPEERPITYIFCDENQDYVVDFFEGDAPLVNTINEMCSVYHIQ